MKKYIGRSQVQAEPMTYDEAVKKQVINPISYVEEYKDNDGFKVSYEDDELEMFEWVPKNLFEVSFKVAETPLDRVNIEVEELKERISKLGNFIFNQNEGKDYQALPLGTRAFLLAQYQAMISYQTLLSLRQSCMEGNEECRPSGLSFEQILPLLKEGFCIRRAGWNGKGLMVFKQVPAHITSTIIPNMQSLPQEAKRLILAHGDHIDYVAQCLIFNSNTGEANSWVPSISDVFAYDWELVME